MGPSTEGVFHLKQEQDWPILARKIVCMFILFCFSRRRWPLGVFPLCLPAPVKRERGMPGEYSWLLQFQWLDINTQLKSISPALLEFSWACETHTAYICTHLHIRFSANTEQSYFNMLLFSLKAGFGLLNVDWKGCALTTENGSSHTEAWVVRPQPVGNGDSPRCLADWRELCTAWPVTVHSVGGKAEGPPCLWWPVTDAWGDLAPEALGITVPWSQESWRDALESHPKAS